LCGTVLYRFGGANCLELYCIGLRVGQIVWNWTLQFWGGKLCGTVLYRFGANCEDQYYVCLWGKMCGTGLYIFGGQIFWNCTLHVGVGKLCGTVLYSFGGKFC
jgi:uncharacterized membrane protein YdjX (TVP38/TMEM64 family)